MNTIDSEVINNAKSFLKSKDLLPENFYLSNQLGSRGTILKVGNQEKNIVTEKTVKFFRKINGFRVLGNSAITVSYDNEGLTGISSAYSDYVFYKNYQCLSFNEAINKVKTSNTLFDCDFDKLSNKINNSIFNDIEIVYYDSPLENEMTHLQPCYLFHGSVTDDSNNTSPFTGLIPAIPEKDTTKN